MARLGPRPVLFLDEVQNLRAWDVQLKQVVDTSDVTCVVTGSSALRIGLGRDSLAGRIQSLDLGTLRLSEIADVRGFGALSPLQTDNGTCDWFGPDLWRELAVHGDEQAAVRDEAFLASASVARIPARTPQPTCPGRRSPTS